MPTYETCHSCPHLRLPDWCTAGERFIIDPARVVCKRHPRAPAEADHRGLTYIRAGARLFWFFGVNDRRNDALLPSWLQGLIEPLHEARSWVEDARGIPVVFTEGTDVSGKPYLSMDFPGGQRLLSSDVLGLASQTSAWRRLVERLGVAELKRIVGISTTFGSFSLTLQHEGATNDRTPAGWPRLHWGCSCVLDTGSGTEAVEDEGGIG